MNRLRHMDRPWLIAFAYAFLCCQLLFLSSGLVGCHPIPVQGVRLP